MTAQLGLFDEPLIHPDTKGMTLQQRFEAFHAANPWVYRRLVAMARSWKSRGRDKVGIATLVEVLRWQYGMATVGDEFYLNNSFRSRYSRLIAKQEPDLREMFELRELKS